MAGKFENLHEILEVGDFVTFRNGEEHEVCGIEKSATFPIRVHDPSEPDYPWSHTASGTNMIDDLDIVAYRKAPKTPEIDVNSEAYKTAVAKLTPEDCRALGIPEPPEPKVIMYKATDKDGEVYLYGRKPEMSGTYWAGPGIPLDALSSDRICENWKDTLVACELVPIENPED